MSNEPDQALKNATLLVDNFDRYKNILLRGLDDNIKFENFNKSLLEINDAYISYTSTMISYLHDIYSKSDANLNLAKRANNIASIIVNIIPLLLAKWFTNKKLDDDTMQKNYNIFMIQ